MRPDQVAMFRASLLAPASLEILRSGRLVLSGSPWRRSAIELVVKLAIQATAYVALSS